MGKMIECHWDLEGSSLLLPQNSEEENITSAMCCVLLRLLISIALLGRYSALDRYPENLSVVKRTRVFSVDCKGSSDMNVSWKMDGETLQTSGHLVLENVDQPEAGNYTCWQNGSLVKHTYLVISEEDQSPIFQSKQVQCGTRTFAGLITCSWQTHGPAFFKVRYCRRNSGVVSECSYRHLNYSSSGTEHHLNFSEDDYSPYAEEYDPITFIVEAVTSVSYQSLQTTFYVGDIVKPDHPQLLSVEPKQKKFIVSWSYPQNWIKPYSYFPLAFDVESKPNKNNRKCKVMLEDLNIPKITVPRACKVRIRAKDRFLSSPWSEWSDWVHIKTKTTT
ncbi:interleukin-12 subunit beta-like [Amblyraja radiata]|uniref:interleukin-12 subunit beta-like n=1 Tax=Amblyraja radiata TaxID=386614 RepID=UPI0014031E5A|nr:interleukin-12 subunit beta-like [Amblyraja radiata]